MTTALVAGLLGLGLLASACSSTTTTKQLDMAHSQAALATAVSRQLGEHVTTPKCPTKIDRKVGVTFRCTTIVRGHLLNLLVTVRTEAGDLRVAPQDVLVNRNEVVLDLTVRLRDKLKRDVSVTCGTQAVRVVPVGSQFTCEARDRASKRSVEVTVRDAAGARDYRILPPPPTVRASS